MNTTTNTTAHLRVFRPEDIGTTPKPVCTGATLPHGVAYKLAHPKSIERISFFSCLEQFRDLQDSPDPAALQFRSDFYFLAKRILSPVHFDIFRFRHLQRVHYSAISKRMKIRTFLLERAAQEVEMQIGEAVIREGILARLRDTLDKAAALPRTA